MCEYLTLFSFPFVPFGSCLPLRPSICLKVTEGSILINVHSVNTVYGEDTLSVIQLFENVEFIRYKPGTHKNNPGQYCCFPYTRKIKKFVFG